MSALHVHSCTLAPRSDRDDDVRHATLCTASAVPV